MCSVALATGCTATVGHELFLHARPLHAADAIVVLGNRPPTNADGSVAPETRRRVRRGAELFREGLAPRLIVAGGPAPGGGTEAAVMAAYAEDLGVDPSAIVREDRSRSTTENAGYTVRLLCEGEAGCRPSLIVVSTPYHLRRATRLFACAGAEVQAAPSDLPPDPFTRTAYTAHEYALAVFALFDDACGRARAIAAGR